MLRPVQILGASPDGVHRYLYRQCDPKGLVVGAPRMFAAEYGINLSRWDDYIAVLQDAGVVRVVDSGRAFTTLLVERPVDYEDAQ